MFSCPDAEYVAAFRCVLVVAFSRVGQARHVGEVQSALVSFVCNQKGTTLWITATDLAALVPVSVPMQVNFMLWM